MKYNFDLKPIKQHRYIAVDHENDPQKFKFIVEHMENVENDTTRFTPFIGSGIVCDNGDSKHFASNWHFDDCDQDQKVAIMNSALTSYSFDSFYKIIKKEIEVFELSRRKVTIVGLNLIKYVSENDEEFWEKETIEEKALIYFKEKDKLFELELCVEYTGCGSGYCEAIVVEQSVTEIDKLPPMGYLVKELKEVPYDTVIGVNVDNEYFDCNSDTCPYYPNDYFNIKMEAFKPTNRDHGKRKVWVVKGDSGLGKTFLTDKLNMDKYETDVSIELPEVILADIVVIGNRRQFDTDDVISRIFKKDEAEIIIVNFEVI